MFLKIENPGVAPVEGFYMLGATTKSSDDENTIGQFGSGNKHAIALCLRHGLDVVTFAGLMRLSFTTKPIGGVFGQKQMIVKMDGRTEDGSQVHRTVELSQCAEYGEKDWKGLPMALREFVSNAIDEATTFNGKSEVKMATPWDGVVIELVQDNQVRAKAGTTRVYIPIQGIPGEEVTKFYCQLGKWFLHFSEPQLLKEMVLPKGERNLGTSRTAVIYRRGVRVREIEYTNEDSLFDYNLNNLEIDECRKMSDWSAKYAASRAMKTAPTECLATILRSLMLADQKTYWEHNLDADYMSRNRWNADNLAETEYSLRFSEALASLGEDVVLTGKDQKDLVARKGYRPLVVPENFVKVAESLGVRTGNRILTVDEKNNRQIVDATTDVQEALDRIWGSVTWTSMDNGKEKPPAKCFHKIMEAGELPLGKYEDGVVLINMDIAVGQSQALRATVLEEIAHHVTGAGDESRDLQDWAFNYAAKLEAAVFENYGARVE